MKRKVLTAALTLFAATGACSLIPARAATQRADIIDRRVEGSGHQPRGVERAGERCIRLDTEHDMV